MLHDHKIELLFIVVRLPQHSFIISSVYIPIRSNISVCNEFFDFVKFAYNKYPKADFFIFG